MHLVPVANEGQDKQDDGDEQQTGGLGGINRMPVVAVSGLIFFWRSHGCWGSHGPILALEIENPGNVLVSFGLCNAGVRSQISLELTSPKVRNYV
jgi:hypothetical protein